MTSFLIAKSLIYTRLSVKIILNKFYNFHKTMAKLLLEPHTDEILSLFDSGMTRTELTRKYQCTYQNLAFLLKRHRPEAAKVNPRVGTINPSYFSVIDTHVKAYFVGFIAGDGCIVESTTSSSKTLTITLNERDDCVLEKLRTELEMSRPLYRFTNKDGLKHVRLVTSNRQIVSDLSKLGIEPRKSLTLGNIIQNIPDQFRNSFILGYFDADGSCCVRDATYFSKDRGRHYTHTKQSIQIRATLDLCKGIVDQLGISKYHINFSEAIPNLSISSKSEFQKFFRLVYENCPFYLQRKRDKFLRIVDQDQTISSPQLVEG